MSLLLLFNSAGSVVGTTIVEAAHAVDLEYAILLPPQPCPCEPIFGPGSGSNPQPTGPGSGDNPSRAGPGIASNIVVPGPGPCKCP